MKKKEKETCLVLACEVDGEVFHKVSFTDSTSTTRTVAVSEELALAVNGFIKKERNQQRWIERRIEQRQLSEEELHHRVRIKPTPLEDIIILNFTLAALEDALSQLSNSERRRFKLRHYHRLKLREISELEKCSIASVSESIKRAEKKIRKLLRDDEPP